MGTYLNPGPQMLREARSSRYYVDKSDMLIYLNSVCSSLQKYVCMSRPRRFGKSTDAGMICAFYDRTVDAAQEFAGMKIADDPSFDERRGEFDVLHINMQSLLSNTRSRSADELIAKLQRDVCFDFRIAYRDLEFRDRESLIDSMQDIYAQTDRQFVVVIDEWDCVMRELTGDEEGQRLYLDFLRGWLKDRTYVGLCYMTGILPIKKYGTHSALNMFSEFSMTSARRMAPYIGFREDQVRDLCTKWGRDFDECAAWYDGYRLRGINGSIFDLYNPKSVVEAVDSGIFESYWNKSETFDALRRYIDLNMDGLHERVVELMAGERVPVNTGTYVNDMTNLNSADDVLTLLIHLGYLAFDSFNEEAYIPNREVLGEFANSMKDGGWDEVSRSIAASDSLLDALISGDEDAVARGVERAHEDASSVIAYNDENSLACTLRLAFFSAIRRWRLVREIPAGKGFADLVLIPLASHPGTPGVVIELKFGESAASALAQIDERGYERSLKGLAANGEVVLCGIAYDPKSKTHQCKIERKRLGEAE